MLRNERPRSRVYTTGPATPMIIPAPKHRNSHATESTVKYPKASRNRATTTA